MMETRRLMVGIGPRQGEPTERDMGNCNPIGVRGGGHHALRRVHAEFNRRFGDARLHIASLQAYVTSCHGHFFAVTYMGSGPLGDVQRSKHCQGCELWNGRIMQTRGLSGEYDSLHVRTGRRRV
ncbi:hypothetical protein OOU_Y34scaffold01170g1 [Pyricularia oryzae Y34]|uniref:Uncharacterized protein n=2 Tax=Pyricularia oryzae TaxID=318829 RepID=A0AA97PF80_PYRO3|nr:hypothetical protein OOU_Y34scaffold01170g1 [Pyricularia oryzae Y34]